MGEDPTVKRNVSKRMSLVIGARHHLEWGHEKYVMDMIHSHPAQVNYFNVLLPCSSERHGCLVLSLRLSVDSSTSYYYYVITKREIIA